MKRAEPSLSPRANPLCERLVAGREGVNDLLSLGRVMPCQRMLSTRKQRSRNIYVMTAILLATATTRTGKWNPRRGSRRARRRLLRAQERRHLAPGSHCLFRRRLGDRA
jgi:hypothetical protein